MLNIYNNCDTPSPSASATLSGGMEQGGGVGGGGGREKKEWGILQRTSTKANSFGKIQPQKVSTLGSLDNQCFFAPSSVTRRERMEVITHPCPRDTVQRWAGTREATPVNWISLAQTGGCMQFLHLTDRPFSCALACRSWAGV